MTPDLYLRLCPEQAEVLGIMLGEPGNLGVALGVVPQLGLPLSSLLFRYNAPDDDASSLFDEVCESLRESTSIFLDGLKADLRDSLGPLFSNSVDLLSKGLGETMVRLDDTLSILWADDGLLELGKSFL